MTVTGLSGLVRPDPDRRPQHAHRLIGPANTPNLKGTAVADRTVRDPSSGDFCGRRPRALIRISSRPARVRGPGTPCRPVRGGRRWQRPVRRRYWPPLAVDQRQRESLPPCGRGQCVANCSALSTPPCDLIWKLITTRGARTRPASPSLPNRASIKSLHSADDSAARCSLSGRYTLASTLHAARDGRTSVADIGTATLLSATRRRTTPVSEYPALRANLAHQRRRCCRPRPVGRPCSLFR